MTQQDDITQRVPMAEEILGAIRSAGYRDHPTNIERKRVDAILSAVEPLLSKLRAPVTEDDEVDRIRGLGPAYPYTPNTAPPTPLASAPVAEEAKVQIEYLDMDNHRLRRALQKLMARLTDLLDEDQFANCESIVTAAGVEPPASAPVAGEALTAEAVERQYRDGVHIGSGLPRATCPCGFCAKHRHGFERGDDLAAPQASAENVRNAALVPHRQEWANRGDGYGHWVDVDEARFVVLAPECRRTLYLPQADKDGGQQRAGDVRDTALSNLIWAASERDKGNRIRQFDQFMDEARAAISSNAAKQGSRDE